MRIASVFLSMPVGGAEDLAVLLARELSGEGVQTRFVCLRDPGAMGEELASLGSPPTLLPVAKGKRFSFRGVGTFARWLVENKIDLVHSHTYHAHLYSIPAAAKAGIPCVLHHHKTLEKMKWHRRILFGWNLRRATAVVALSSQTAKELQSTFRVREDRVFALPNAVDATQFFPATPAEKLELRRQLRLPESGLLAATVASLQKVKNLDCLLHASADSRGGISHYFFGEGPERESLQRTAKELKISHRTTFAGRCRPVAPWLRAMDLFVFPSFWEGQSLALLQALSCGLPVLASRIEGNTAVLGETHPGLFSPQDSQELTALLDRFAAPDSGLRETLRRATADCQLPSLANLAASMKSVYDFANQKTPRS